MSRLRTWTWRGGAAIAALAASAGMLLAAAPGLAQAAAPTVTTRADAVIQPTTNAATGANTFTALTPITITATGNEMTTANGIKIEAPTGWSFDTSAPVTYTVGGTGTLQIGGAATGTVTPTQHEIVLNVTTGSAAGDTLMLSGIKVQPDTADTASGTIGISLDGDATVSNGTNDVADVTSLSALAVNLLGKFDRPIDTVGVNPVIWQGGTVQQMASATLAAQGISVTVFVNGKAQVLIPGAPAFVNAEFNATYPSTVPAGTIVLVVK